MRYSSQRPPLFFDTVGSAAFVPQRLKSGQPRRGPRPFQGPLRRLRQAPEARGEGLPCRALASLSFPCLPLLSFPLVSFAFPCLALPLLPSHFDGGNALSAQRGSGRTLKF